MILPVVTTTRNRSLRGVGSPVSYLDAFTTGINADDWAIRTPGVRIIRSATEKRLSFSTREFGKLRRGDVLDIEIEFIFKNVFVAYTISPEPNYAYFAVPNVCGSILFDELLEKQPALNEFNWREDDTDLVSLSGDASDVFGLWIRFKKQEHLFSFRDCENYDILNLRF